MAGQGREEEGRSNLAESACCATSASGLWRPFDHMQEVLHEVSRRFGCQDREMKRNECISIRELIDEKSKTWTDNMTKAGKANIANNGRKEEFTKVMFTPDLKRFGMDSIDDDTVALLKRCVYDMAGTVKNVKVFLNDERPKITYNTLQIKFPRT